YDRFHKNVANIYRVVYKKARPDSSIESAHTHSGYFQGPRFAAGIPDIRYFIRLKENYRDLKTGTAVTSQQIFETDSVFFRVFDFTLLSGNRETALLQPNGVVISEDIARKQFGTTDAIGKTILFKDGDGFVPF